MAVSPKAAIVSGRGLLTKTSNLIQKIQRRKPLMPAGREEITPPFDDAEFGTYPLSTGNTNHGSVIRQRGKGQLRK
jgi:hypothetical protein